MTTKSSSTNASPTAADQPKRDPNVLRIPIVEGKSAARQEAEVILSPTASNTKVARIYAQKLLGDIDFTAAHKVVNDEIEKIKRGDLECMEATLAAQAIVLDKIFGEFAHRASSALRRRTDVLERFMHLALRAQEQCVATVHALGELKGMKCGAPAD